MYSECTVYIPTPARTGGWCHCLEWTGEDMVQTSGGWTNHRSGMAAPSQSQPRVESGRCPLKLRTVSTGHATPVPSAKLSRTLPSLRAEIDTKWIRHCLSPVTSERSVKQSLKMMISQFWNLCRACPALDVDKVIFKCRYLVVLCVGIFCCESSSNFCVPCLLLPRNSFPFWQIFKLTIWILFHVWEEFFFWSLFVRARWNYLLFRNILQLLPLQMAIAQKNF